MIQEKAEDLGVDPRSRRDEPQWPLSSLELDDLIEELRGRARSARASQERLGSLLSAVLAVSSDLELTEVLHRIVLAACELVDAKYGALGVIGTSGEELVEFVTHGVSEEERAAIGPLPRGHGLLGLIIRSPQPQRVNNIGQHADSYGFPANHPPMTSFLGAPVRIRDQVFGNLYLTDKRSAPVFTGDDEAILSALAAAAGVAIENARLYERARTQQAWGALLSDATQALLAEQERDEVLADVSERVRGLTRAGACVIALRHGGDLLVAASSGLAEDVPQTSPGDTVRDPEVLAAMAAPPALVGSGEEGTRALVPLTLGDTPLGMLDVTWDTGDQGDQLQHLEEFGRSLAVSLGAAAARNDRARSELLEDRDRIARDMHDNVIQRLFATGMSLQSAGPMSPPTVRDKLDNAVDELDATIKDIRHAIFALHRVPGGRPLTAEIATVCGDAAVTLGFTPNLRLTGPVADIPETLGAELLAVVREALSNAARHARATTVAVDIEAADHLAVTVVDDGRGLPEGATRSGLANLARRAQGRGGHLTVSSATEQPGTRLEWKVPLNRPVR